MQLMKSINQGGLHRRSELCLCECTTSEWVSKRAVSRTRADFDRRFHLGVTKPARCWGNLASTSHHILRSGVANHRAKSRPHRRLKWILMAMQLVTLLWLVWQKAARKDRLCHTGYLQPLHIRTISFEATQGIPTISVSALSNLVISRPIIPLL